MVCDDVLYLYYAGIYIEKLIGNYSLSEKYYLIMAFLNYNKRSIFVINDIIEHDFNLNDSIKLINVLNDHNHDILNNTLKFLIEI